MPGALDNKRAAACDGTLQDSSKSMHKAVGIRVRFGGIIKRRQ